MTTGKGSADLESEVLSRGLCTGCGACVNICPYVKVVRDRVAVIEPCGVAEGQCYDYCPRTPTDVAALDRALFGSERSDVALGSFVSVEMAQARDEEVRRRAQYGGVVSALLAYAMSTGEIGSAVLTRPFDNGLMPSAAVADQSSQIAECAGSNYVSSATLAELNRSSEKLGKSVGVVGIPCQIAALRKMQESPHDSGAGNVKLAIGLFCTWALTYSGLLSHIKDRLDPATVRRIDIPPPPANVITIHTDDGSVQLSLDDVRDAIRPACGTCFDMTSEFADISVGMVEGMDDWNTLIVRTPAGEALVQKAKADGVIDSRPLDEARLAHLREASLNKKRRAIAEIVERTGDEANLMYLVLSDAERTSLL
jgi:coenzyme F420-reducing hydrogenase beta subunit